MPGASAAGDGALPAGLLPLAALLAAVAPRAGGAGRRLPLPALLLAVPVALVQAAAGGAGVEIAADLPRLRLHTAAQLPHLQSAPDIYQYIETFANYNPNDELVTCLRSLAREQWWAWQPSLHQRQELVVARQDRQEDWIPQYSTAQNIIVLYLSCTDSSAISHVALPAHLQYRKVQKYILDMTRTST